MISVVMPVGPPNKFIASAIEALAAQDCQWPWELVFSVNANIGENTELLSKLCSDVNLTNFRVTDSTDRRGAGHARNVGAQEAVGEILLFCDSDDVPWDSWVASAASYLLEHPNTVIGGHLEEMRLTNPKQRYWRPPATPGRLPMFHDHKYIVSANLGISRFDFESVGGFRTDLGRCEDIALSWDLANKGVSLDYVGSAVISYRHRPGLLGLVGQHYNYGRGFSQLLATCPAPGSSAPAPISQRLRPNAAAVGKRSWVNYCRRGSIAAGRLVGLVENVGR